MPVCEGVSERRLISGHRLGHGLTESFGLVGLRIWLVFAVLPTGYVFGTSRLVLHTSLPRCSTSIATPTRHLRFTSSSFARKREFRPQ